MYPFTGNTFGLLGNQQAAPKMSIQSATQGAGLTLDPMTNMYYEPSSGQFYKTGVASSSQFSNPLFNILGNTQNTNPFLGIYGNMRNQEPSNVLNYGGYTFNPFTGSMDGITKGFFSPIGRFEPQTQQIAPPVGILNSLFGNIDFSGAAQAGQGYGAGRFLGTSK